VKVADLKVFPGLQIILCDVFGVIAWSYFVTKLFFIDIDRLIIGHVSPELVWIVDLRFVAFICVLSIILVTLGKNKSLFLLFYIAAFPLIVVIWKIPFLLIKTKIWALGLAIINSILSIFTHLRYKIVVMSAYCLSMTLVLFSDTNVIIKTGMVILAAAIFSSYARAFASAFRAPRVFATYKKLSDFGEKFNSEKFN
jgi:hypothetical protein